MDRFIGAAVRVDRDVITTLGDALGRDRPLVTPVGMLGMTSGRLATEDDVYDPNCSAVRARPSRRTHHANGLKRVRDGFGFTSFERYSPFPHSPFIFLP
jgi:hypothetical protein